MNSLHLVSFLMILKILTLQCEGKTEIGDFIVDCSACNYLPLKGVDSYQCNVRCEAHGECFLQIYCYVMIFPCSMCLAWSKRDKGS